MCCTGFVTKFRHSEAEHTAGSSHVVSDAQQTLSEADGLHKHPANQLQTQIHSLSDASMQQTLKPVVGPTFHMLSYIESATLVEEPSGIGLWSLPCWPATMNSPYQQHCQWLQCPRHGPPAHARLSGL
jgi:hypothetical protein